MLFIIIMPQMNGGTSYLFNAELPGAVAERTLPKIKASAALILFIYFGLTVLEIGLLMLSGLPFFQAFNLALATMATGGFSYYHDSLISFHNVAVEVIAIVFMLISSMNFSLYYKFWRGDWQAIRQDSEHRYYLALILVSTVLICGDLYMHDYLDFGQALRHSFFQSVSIASTTGFASDDFNQWPSVKMGKRDIDPVIVGNITRFFFLYIFVFMVLSVLISISGISVLESFGIVAACMSSVGPAFGIVGPTSTYANLPDWARFISVVAMLLGRLEIFTLLAIMRPDFWRDKQNW